MPEVEFFGEKFGLYETPNEFAMMAWADIAEHEDGNYLALMATTFRLLKESIIPEDWERFEAHARKNRAESSDLFKVVFAVYTQATDRPTGLPVDSSAGQEIIPLKSESKPADPVMDRFEGRPDMQLAVIRSRRSA